MKSSLRILALTACAAAFGLAAGAAQAADPAEGEWMTPGGRAKVRIGPCQIHREHLCGTIVWLKAPRLDSHNPDPRLRGRSIVGITFLSGFERVRPGVWKDGSIYDPEGGKTYDSHFAVQPDGALKLDGCVLMFCRTQVWRRSQ